MQAEVKKGGAESMLQSGRRVLALVAVLGVAFAAPGGAGAKQQDAGAFLESLSRDAFAKLTDPSLNQAQKEQNFRDLFRATFDLPAISRFVLGKHWRRASTGQRQAFIDAFEEMHMRRFLPLFAEYSADVISVLKVQQDAAKPSVSLVSTTIQQPEGEPFSVVWRIMDQDGQYKVLDIVAEGVSMAIALRHEYGAVVKTHGLDGLIAMIREKSEELAAE